MIQEATFTLEDLKKVIPGPGVSTKQLQHLRAAQMIHAKPPEAPGLASEYGYNAVVDAAMLFALADLGFSFRAARGVLNNRYVNARATAGHRGGWSGEGQRFVTEFNVCDASKPFFWAIRLKKPPKRAGIRGRPESLHVDMIRIFRRSEFRDVLSEIETGVLIVNVTAVIERVNEALTKRLDARGDSEAKGA